jgi:hypothetical protein
MRSRRIRFVAFMVLVALLTLIARSLRADEPRGLRVALEPRSVAAGEIAALRVASDGQHEAPAPRPVPGLEIFPAGRSQSMTSINGVVSATTTLTYGVRASRAGSFTISVGDKTVQLDVHAGAAGTGAAAPTAPSIAAGAPAASASTEGAHGRAFVRLLPSKRHAFVGEAVPLTIKAYFEPGTEVTLNGPPKLSSAAFTIAPLGEPQQARELVGGRPFHVVTWHTTITAALAGNQRTVVELPATLRWLEEGSPAEDPFRRFFGDDDPFADVSPFKNGSPFASSLFGGVPRQRDVTLRSDTVPSIVEALPTQGRPADFQGAVGRFELGSQLDGTDARAYDPLKLTVEVRGTGDLDRVRNLGIATSADWKAYASTTPKQAAASGDARTFTQDIVPLRDGELTVPAVQLSYFDPVARRYVTKRSEAIPVRVAAAAPGAGISPVAGATPPGESTGSQVAAADGIDDSRHAHVRPLALRGGFLALNALPPLLCLGALLFARLRRARRSSALEARRAVRRGCEAMRAARAADDRAGWLAAARRVLQLRLAPAWRLPADDVDAAVVAARAPHAKELIALFQASERAAYGRATAPSLDLAALDAVVERHLNQEVIQ